MSIEQKASLVASVCPEHELQPALDAVGLAKSTWYYHQKQKVSYTEKHGHLVPPLEEIARQHPEYGYRRATAELREAYGQLVNHKVVQRLHQLWGLSLLRQTRPPRPSGVRKAILAAGQRANLVAQLTEIQPFQVAYTDFTELRYADGNQKSYLMAIVGHVCKVVYGWAVGESPNTHLALAAWQCCKETLRAHDVACARMIMHHDQDPVYTGYGWTSQLLLNDGLHLSYSLDGAKANTEMEGFISRFKNENRSLFLDAPTQDALQTVVRERMYYYNYQRRHSRIDYQTPIAYLKQLKSRRSSSP